MMSRVQRCLAMAALVCTPVLAHHGWSSFDQDKPVYLEGQVKAVRWANPHAEVTLIVDAALKAPSDLATRPVPPQAQAVDGPAVMKKAQAPSGAAGEWTIEFAPLSRMERWGVTPLKAGDRIEVVGYTGVPGEPKLLRVEFLFVGGKAYGLRSNPR